MVAWSSMLVVEGSTSSEGSTRLHQWPEALKCFVCGEFYSKPRILPCGHTFCADCLTKLRETALRDFNRSRDRNAHRRGDCGYFNCPWPNCHYTMKIMNVYRWTPRNKAAAEAVSMYKKQQHDKQEMSAQTDWSFTDLLSTLPRALLGMDAGMSSEPTPTPTMLSAAIHQGLQNAFSTDNLNRNISPTSGMGWRSYAAMFGLTALEQFI